MENLIFFIPIVSGFLMSYICTRGRRSDFTVKSRPPSYIFRIIWTILYILIGISWIESRKNLIVVDFLYSLLILLLCLWIFLYGCKKNKKLAMYSILLSIMITIFILIYSKPYYLVPLLIWLLFALMLNFEEVNNLS